MEVIDEETATPSGMGVMSQMSTRMEASFVMHTFAPESAMKDVWDGRDVLRVL